MAILENSLGQSHELVKMVVKPGDTVVDATAGNGYDTLMLAELVGDSGKVYSFDVQERAICSTRSKLEAAGFLHRVNLINNGHENMNVYVAEKPRAVMFNLGYLPGGDHSISTKPETTTEAIEKASEKLLVNGLITIVIYYGGDSGFEEKNRVLDFVGHMDCKRFAVMKTEFVNQINCPPILVCIEKLKG